MKTIDLCLAVVFLAGCSHRSDPRIMEAAEKYPGYGRVDDVFYWSPVNCADPPPAPPKVSVSRDLATHGRKLYYLFAKHRGAYLHARELPQPVGQVLVKQSWKPGPGSTFSNPIAGDAGPLFMMIKIGDEDSDAGWIYATVAPDGKTVTASGKIASCMECHQAAKHDRLFGLKSCAAAE